MDSLDVDDIQGNVARGYNLPCAAYLHFRARSCGDIPSFVGHLVPQVTPERTHEKPLCRTLNVALTAAGLRKSGISDDLLATFPSEFVEGMAQRSRDGKLGDSEANGPGCWEVYRIPPVDQAVPTEDCGPAPAAAASEAPPPVDLIVIIQGRDKESVEEKIAEVGALAVDDDVACVYTQCAQVLAGGQRRNSREHFGFVDGISQPVIDPCDIALAGGGIPGDDGGWTPLEPGEFFLGYPEITDPYPVLPRPWELVRNGSYMVYRKIQQNVAAYQEFLETLARIDPGARLAVADAGGNPDRLGSKFFGRHPDGRPLVPVPAGPAPNPALLPARNDFRYETDPKGRGCPLGSHIRRANPRDGLDFGADLVQRHRLIRRGMPYGPPYDAGLPDGDPRERGLVFVAYCSSISRQYEFVQRRWINDGDGLGIGHDPDPIIGTGPAPTTFVVQGKPARIIKIAGNTPETPPAPLVRVKWGEYFFQPGISALEWLSEL